MLISEEYKAEFSHSFDVYFVKLPCAIALHLCLYPEVAAGMNIMKVANQQVSLFEEYTSEFAFLIGFNQVILALFCEAVNVYMLTF